jgi:hypothetical protein
MDYLECGAYMKNHQHTIGSINYFPREDTSNSLKSNLVRLRVPLRVLVEILVVFLNLGLVERLQVSMLGVV